MEAQKREHVIAWHVGQLGANGRRTAIATYRPESRWRCLGALGGGGGGRREHFGSLACLAARGDVARSLANWLRGSPMRAWCRATAGPGRSQTMTTTRFAATQAVRRDAH